MPKSATIAWPPLEQDVLRLDVPVDDPVAVGVAEGGGHLRGRCRSASSSGSWPSPEPDGPGATRPDVGHDVVEQPAGLAGVVEREDVGMLQPGGDRISRRKRSGPSAAAISGWSTLSATAPVVLEVLGQVDHGHAAAAELAAMIS